MKTFCPRCNRTSAEGSKYCTACLEKTRTYWAERRRKLPVGLCKKCCIRETEAGYRKCVHCRADGAKRMREYKNRWPEKSRQRMRDWWKAQRTTVLNHYGGQCECCGESTFEFLVLDHKNGGGNAHRSEVRTKGSGMIRWAITNGFPDLFRVLCHNCNSAIGFYGACPHQRTKDE